MPAVKENHARPPIPGAIRNLFHALAGGIVLPLNQIRHGLLGYTNPRTFPLSEVDRAAAYDRQVVIRWLEHLESTPADGTLLRGKRVLELGPGDNLGVGVIMLAMGAATYTAVDVHPLVGSVPDELYETIFQTLETDGHPENRIADARRALDLCREGEESAIRYVCRPDFDLTSLGENSIDLIVSQAAFEHFSDVGKTIGELGKLTAPGGRFVAEIDLKTHTRWIRDVDPLNIYRYPAWFYDRFKFNGSPNRVRPDEYVRHLELAGWRNIQVFSTESLTEEYVARVRPHLTGSFRSREARMNDLVVTIVAEHG